MLAFAGLLSLDFHRKLSLLTTDIFAIFFKNNIVITIEIQDVMDSWSRHLNKTSFSLLTMFFWIHKCFLPVCCVVGSEEPTFPPQCPLRKLPFPWGPAQVHVKDKFIDDTC